MTKGNRLTRPWGGPQTRKDMYVGSIPTNFVWNFNPDNNEWEVVKAMPEGTDDLVEFCADRAEEGVEHRGAQGPIAEAVLGASRQSSRRRATRGSIVGPKGNDIYANTPEEELMNREAALAAEVERLLPEFVNSCRDRADVVIIHQDAFAADYQDHEYALLGKAIKFAGLHGKEVHIIGKNRETLKGSSRPELIQ